jgi:hypothetical protein
MYIEYLDCPLLGDLIAKIGWKVVMVIQWDLIHLINMDIHWKAQARMFRFY